MMGNNREKCLLRVIIICIFARQDMLNQYGRIILHIQLFSAVLHVIYPREGHREIHQKRPRLA